MREEYSRNILRGRGGRLAYALAQDSWHRQHGEKMPLGRCAGCGAPVHPTDNVLALPDGAAVHSADNSCLIAYGRKWRGIARAGLASLGINPPADWVE